MPLFFLLLDSWLLLAGAAGVVAVESVEVPVAAGDWVVSVPDPGVSVAAGAALLAGAASAAGAGKALGLPGVMVSTAAVLPTLEPVEIGRAHV